MRDELYRFLLVDDEEIIRNGISKSIDWISEGFEFLVPCADGQEAIESIATNDPDVVLTDICMPNVDGLEIARFINENHPNTLTLILSGYDDFEYAQKAMSYQVMDYILKPISSRSLKKHLEQIRMALGKRDESRESRSHLLELLENSRAAVRDRYLSRLLAGHVGAPDPEILNDELVFLKETRFFGVIALEIDIPETELTDTDISSDLLFLSMEEASREVLASQHNYACISTADNRLVIIVGRAEDASLIRQLNSIANEILERIQQRNGFTSSAGIGLAVMNVSDIFMSYRQAVAALQYRLLAGNNGTFVFRPENHSDLNIRVAVAKCCDDIRRDVRIGHNEDALGTAREFIQVLQSGELGPRHARREIVKFLSAILDALEDVGIARSDAPGGKLADQLYDAMDVVRVSELDTILKGFFKSVAAILETRRDSYPRKKLNEIIRYIDIHFADPVLSTETVAERFYISSGYLTKLFRKHLDKSFLEYLNSLKMTQAQELLKTSDLKNYEIAEQLGFKDPHYFSSSFKKHFGMTPKEYKNSI